MKVAGIYSFNQGKEVMEGKFPVELDEILDTIAKVDAAEHKTKVSKEKTMPGRILYKPGSLNKAFKQEFGLKGWRNHTVQAEYSTKYYVSNYERPETVRGAFRDMDFVKNRVGVEVQFGKYAFMVYNVAAKMTIFHNKGIIKFS